MPQQVGVIACGAKRQKRPATDAWCNTRQLVSAASSNADADSSMKAAVPLCNQSSDRPAARRRMSHATFRRQPEMFFRRLFALSTIPVDPSDGPSRRSLMMSSQRPPVIWRRRNGRMRPAHPLTPIVR
jgi:hypothetical protein